VAAPTAIVAGLRADEAYVVIDNGYLWLDRDEWIRAVEKRRAALGWDG
jgi:hypothetical protein